MCSSEVSHAGTLTSTLRQSSSAIVMSLSNLDLFDVTHRGHGHGVLGVIGDPLLSG